MAILLNIGVGAVLVQSFNDDKLPVYASRKLNPVETRYTTIERECLAILWWALAMEKYRYAIRSVKGTANQTADFLSRYTVPS